MLISERKGRIIVMILIDVANLPDSESSRGDKVCLIDTHIAGWRDIFTKQLI